MVISCHQYAIHANISIAFLRKQYRFYSCCLVCKLLSEVDCSSQDENNLRTSLLSIMSQDFLTKN